MRQIETSNFESGGVQLVSFQHNAPVSEGSHSYWCAILTIEAAEEFVGRLLASIEAAKAARQYLSSITHVTEEPTT
jgi:hypothetical protein